MTGGDESAVDGEADRAADVAGVVRVSPNRAGRERLRRLGRNLPDRDSAGLGDLADEGVDGLGTLACLHVHHDRACTRVGSPTAHGSRYGLACKLVDGNLPPVECSSSHRHCGDLGAGGSDSGRLALHGEADNQLLLGSVEPDAAEGHTCGALGGRGQLGGGRLGLEPFLDLLLGQAKLLLHGERLARYCELLAGRCRLRLGACLRCLAGDYDRAQDERGC